MTPPTTARPADRSWLLIVTAAVVLTAFYYLTRADVVGVTGAGRDWTPMTSRPLLVWGHFAASAVLLGVIPVFVARAIGLRSPDIGLGLGNVRLGLALLAAGIPLAVLAG